MLSIGEITFNAVDRPISICKTRYIANDKVHLAIQAIISDAANDYRHKIHANTLVSLRWSIRHRSK